MNLTMFSEDCREVDMWGRKDDGKGLSPVLGKVYIKSNTGKRHVLEERYRKIK